MSASAPLLPWKPGPAVHPAGTRPPGCWSARGAGGAWVSLGPRPSPAYGGHAARLGLPRWGPGARRSQLRGHETQTVTRSGLRFRGRTAIPARKRECRAEATPGGKGAHGLLPYCAPALRPWRPGRGPRHTRVVTEPEDVTPGGRPGGPQRPGGRTATSAASRPPTAGSGGSQVATADGPHRRALLQVAGRVAFPVDS